MAIVDSKFDSTAAERTPNEAPRAVPPPGRVHAVDVLRGFAMLILISMGPLKRGILSLDPGPWGQAIVQQLSHPLWHGITFIDIGFPAFVSLMGVSISLAIEKTNLAAVLHSTVLWRATQRATLLFVLGIVYNMPALNDWTEPRYLGVLQRLAICSLLTTAAVLYLRTRTIAVLIVGVMLAYWATFAWIAPPGRLAGDFSFTGNLAAHVDSRWLPGRKFFTTWDSEGLLSTIPAVATCLFGALVGQLLIAWRARPTAFNVGLFVAGIILLDIGYVWGSVFPINKWLWTSSFATLIAGYCCLIFAVTHQVVDVWQVRRWARPFEVLGRNALVAYIAARFITFDQAVIAMAGGWLEERFGAGVYLAIGLAQIAIVWLTTYFLFRARWFLTLRSLDAGAR